MEAARPPAIVQPSKPCAVWVQQWEAIETKHETIQGEFLLQFKESGAWKTDFKTWGAAVEHLFGISAGHSRRLISAHAESVASDPKGSEEPNTSDKNDKDNSEDVMPPATHITQPKKKKEKKEPDIPRDCTGYPIPQRCMDLWNSRQEVQDYMTMASQLKCLMEKLQSDKRDVYAALDGNIQTHMTSLQTMHYHLSLCKPWAVCPVCDGTGMAPVLMNPSKKASCNVCSGGMVSERVFNGEWQTGHTQKERDALIEKRKSKCIV